ncbi:hypothetical protein CDD83_7757 [Cordyceps sp. RAO-2017]|nr:hypothetical protein CDD83_7757 [Cordyceps sp. RAO-2017]
MPQYRVEVSPNNRAVCKDTVCKKEQVKILKGEIRFGSWVEIHEHGSWSWKHWGCVSGSQLVNLQEACSQGDETYDFDAIDGYDELNDYPEIQEKIRRCVKQGHIDPEDFKGDPEKNKPGESGIRLTAKQKKDKAAAQDASEDEAPKKTPAKRGRKKVVDEDDEDEQPTAKKAKTTKGAKQTKTAASGPTRRQSSGKKAPALDETDEAATEDEAPPVKQSRKPSARASGAVKAKEPAKARGKAADDAADSGKKGRRSSRAAAKPFSDEGDMNDTDELAPTAKSKRESKAKAEQAKPRRGRPRKA